MDLIFGGFIHLPCVMFGIGINLRWQRKNKISKWQSTDIIRFFMYLTSLYHIYATVRTNFVSGILTNYEWYGICIVHGFTSGPLYSYGRSIIAEITMIGYEGLYIGLIKGCSLILSLLIPITIEMTTTTICISSEFHEIQYNKYMR